MRFLILLVYLAFAASAPAGESVLRQTINLNRDWKFTLGDVKGAERPAFDDASWDSIGLPHTFSLPYFLSKDFYVGYGWYRKGLEVPASWAGKRVCLEFEAAFQDAEIYVNGAKAGSHQGGYVGFQIDVTSALKPGNNTIAVRLNNLWNAQLAPRAGEHTFSGGLYRNVWLVVTDPVHVTWCGSSVTTPQVSKSEATVRVETEVRNDGKEPGQVEVRTVLLDPEGETVARLASRQSVAAGGSAVFSLSFPGLKNPTLWHPDQPRLYRAVSQVYLGSTAVDRDETAFGIRWFAWTPDKGFFLNGEPLYLRGANVHQDHAGWGDAVTDAAARRDVKLMKDAGFNFIRGSHYPHSSAFVRACDELGMLFWSENCFWGIGGFQGDGYWNCSTYPVDSRDEQPFRESVKHSLRSMIRIHRNHPSIIAWSMSNEPFFTEKSMIPAMSAFLRELVDLSHQLDPTRPAAIGGAQRPLGDQRIDKIGDVAGYNGDGNSIPIFQNPGVPNLVSEYGSVSSDRPGKYEPNWGELAKGKREPDLYAWRSGLAIWCGFDHGSIAGANLGKMGIVDYFRIPKRAWYWYRNAYAKVAPPAWPGAGQPRSLKLQADKVTGIGTDGRDDVSLLVTVLDAAGKPISNSPPVELAIVSGPGEFPTGPSIRFAETSDIRIQDGQAAIEFRSYRAGSTVIRASSPGLEPTELKITFTGPVPFIVGQTQPVQARPYTRFQPGNSPKPQQQFGYNNPTFVSSAAEGLASGLATDGNEATAWRPAPADPRPALTVDTEKRLKLSQVNLVFPEKSANSCNVEVSDDGRNWKLIADSTHPDPAQTTRAIRVDEGTLGRWVRVSFPAAKTAALAEIRITGVVID